MSVSEHSFSGPPLTWEGLLTEEIFWEPIPGRHAWYRATVRGKEVEMRLNDFPDELLCTVVIAGVSKDQDGWGQRWHWPVEPKPDTSAVVAPILGPALQASNDPVAPSESAVIPPPGSFTLFHFFELGSVLAGLVAGAVLGAKAAGWPGGICGAAGGAGAGLYMGRVPRILAIVIAIWLGRRHSHADQNRTD